MSDEDEGGREPESDDAPLPRATTAFFGHEVAEQALLDGYRGGRIPHAWLIGGSPGIGKATLAYRMARFVLAHPDPAAPAVQKATSLAVDPDNPVTHRIAAEAHGDLLTLERRLSERGTLRQDIAVDDVRKLVQFFGQTASEGGWRVTIVDTVEDLNKPGENALLKVLEEPPVRSLLFLISNAPGRVLPTLRSRCRRLLLRPLAESDVRRAAAAALGRSSDDPEIAAAASVADGSVARALAMLDGDALALRQRVTALLAGLPAYDPRALHALGDTLGGPDQRNFTTFVGIVNDWLSARLATGPQDTPHLARVAYAFEKVNTAAREAETYNLDRKPFVFSAFGTLAEAVRD